MVEAFADPGSALARGISQGFTMAKQSEEQKNIQKAREWEKDLNIAKLSLELGTNKNLPADMRANALNNGMVPVWNKYKIGGIEHKPFTAEDFNDKLLTETTDSVSKILADKTLNRTQKYEATTNAWTSYYKSKGDAGEASKLQTDMMKHMDTKEKDNTPKPPSPDDAFKRQTEIINGLGKMGGTDFNEQMMAGFAQKAGINIQPGQKMSPEMLAVAKRQAQSEYESLNQYLPEDQRHYIVSADDYAKLKATKGITDKDLSRVYVLP